MTAGNVRWLTTNGHSSLSNGVSFGMPWPKGLYQPDQAFVIEGNDKVHPLDCRVLALWEDGSLKWTAHSVSGPIEYSEAYTVKGINTRRVETGIFVDENGENINITTNLGLQLKFGSPGSSSCIESLSVNGLIVCSGVHLVASLDKREFSTIVKTVVVENMTCSRAVVKISGVMVSSKSDEHLPFDVRVYLYSDALPVKIVHSFVHDLDADISLTSLGLRFRIPMENTELYNRHIRFGGSNGSILREEVQGLSGLRYGPTIQNRMDQNAGQAVNLERERWIRTDLDKGLSYIPAFGSYSLSQLSSDGFTIKKRTKEHCSWVKVTGGGRADGTVYLGSARKGGVAVGMSDFWERYPTQLDLSDLTKDSAFITAWMYSPLAEPLDTSPYHDGLGLHSYEEQLEALKVTYEDYEPGFATANGIARTNQFFLKPYTATPSNEELGSFSCMVRDPPRLVATAEYMHSTDVFHGCWAPDFNHLTYTPSRKEMEIEQNLDLLFNYYLGQVEQHRWYGFWDHGDVQHTYDPYRHAWRYDVGGFAWDNSELSTDLWLWLYFLHSGRADVFKMAEAMTRHTGEVDVYHAGPFKGFGTRHGVQHFSCSSKQLRVSNVVYKRVYYYLTGDERTGDLISELQDCQFALLGLDSHRKVQGHAQIPEGFAMVNIGLDCGALVAAWLTSWERRSKDWMHARDLLMSMLNGIAKLKHGLGTNAIMFNPTTGEVRECPPPTPEYKISHLSMLFGFPEIFAELFHYATADYPLIVESFKKIWISYCRAYNGGPEIQLEEFGYKFPADATWRQSHSTLTAFAAVELQSEELAKAAWKQFFNTDGYNHRRDWAVSKVAPPEYFRAGEEATWISTNETARYGVSAIVNLANIQEYIE